LPLLALWAAAVGLFWIAGTVVAETEPRRFAIGTGQQRGKLPRAGGARQDGDARQNGQDQYGARQQPDAGHFQRHFDPSLSQVPSQSEETGCQQQHQSGCDVSDQAFERERPRRCIAGWNKNLSETDQRQCDERYINDPDSGGMFFLDRFAIEPESNSFFDPVGDQYVPGLAIGGRRQGAEQCRAAGGQLLEAGNLEQSISGRIFSVVDDGAVPGQLVGGPPDQREQSGVEQERRQEPEPRFRFDEEIQAEVGGGGEGQSVDAGIAVALFDGEPRDRDRTQDDHGQHPENTKFVVATVEGFNEEEHQAADHHHDQRRVERQQDIVGRRLGGSTDSVLGRACQAVRAGVIQFGHRLIVTRAGLRGQGLPVGIVLISRRYAAGDRCHGPNRDRPDAVFRFLGRLRDRRPGHTRRLHEY